MTMSQEKTDRLTTSESDY